MDKITQQTLKQIDELETKVTQLERDFYQVGSAKVPVYFGVVSRAKEGFANLRAGLDEMRFVLTRKGFPPEG